ncbi:MAG: monovalent cation:proton antiporter-2 (CPA2) family protein [Bacteroidales bacterium]|jgi:CPA2 family monovalent cation:H+ antiporter-2|nr:monovalent cation:proton antiporter-2 (CPA2) family protein [Bacteroidales bacterium]
MEMGVLKDIVIIFALSTFVNFIFNRIKIPAIIGYLITGIIAGPYLLKLISSPENVEVMAEIGVILLMFTIGLEFSLNHLLKIRRIVFLGGFMQLLLTAGVTMLVARVYRLEWTESVFVGFLTALSSTAVVLKLLQERSELTTHYGKTIVGILIFQDIILIPLLLITPILGGASEAIGHTLLVLTLKAAGIIIFIWVGNTWLMPWVLHIIAKTHSQELFLMSILLICLAVAMLTNELGMSLAFGAFLAGLMISDTEYSHNAFGNLIPFKDVFTSFFFVSIGMLLDLGFVYEHPWLVIVTVLLVIVLKTVIAGFTAFTLGHTFLGTVVVGLSLAQVGEFSFILARLGLDNEIITPYHYQLFLAVAITSMALSPLLIQVSRPLAGLIMKLPLPPYLVNGLFPLEQVEIPEISKHVVLIGKDSRAINLAAMIKTMELPFTAIIFDPDRARTEMEKGHPVVFGDATNEPVLRQAFVHTAEMVVLSVGNLITSMSIIEHIRAMNKHAHIIVRTRHVTDIEDLYRTGANQVIPEEFETAIDFFERILGKYLIPRMDIERAIARTREDNYGIFREKGKMKGYSLLRDIPDMEIAAIKVGEDSLFAGKTIAETALRKTCGVTMVAIRHDDKIIPNPEPSTVINGNNIVYLLGKPEMIAVASNILTESRPD